MSPLSLTLALSVVAAMAVLVFHAVGKHWHRWAAWFGGLLIIAILFGYLLTVALNTLTPEQRRAMGGV